MKDPQRESPRATAPASRLTGVGSSGTTAPTHRPKIPDHELVGWIGSGSYGDVWLGRNVMGTHRAVKIVQRERFQKQEHYEREFRGIKMYEPVSRTHDDLIDILQVGRNDEQGYYYYVMEVADDDTRGQAIEPERYRPKTLSQLVFARGRLPIDECIQLGLSLADGLKHLHSHELVHRDIKPSNIVFINGILKIADIGLVTTAGDAASSQGTPGYIAPEGPGTPRADIFSLGKVLYEISTGKDRLQYPECPTNVGDGPEAQMFFEFNAIVLKACAGNPHHRYQSAEELQEDLLLLRAGKSVRRLRSVERRLRILTRVGTVAGVLVLAGYFHLSQQRKLVMQNLASSYVAYGTRLSDQHDLLGALPSYAAALALQKGDSRRASQHRLHLGVCLRQCPKLVQMWFLPVSANSVNFSPSGNRLVVAGASGLAYVLDLANDEPRFELKGHSTGSFVENAAFSPDGRLIVTASEDGTARVWDADTGKEVSSLSPLKHQNRVWNQPANDTESSLNSRAPAPVSVFCARFNPRGDTIATGCEDGGVRLWDLGKLERPRVCFQAHTGAVLYVSFSPDGNRMVTCSRDFTARLWDVATGRPLHDKPLAHGNWVYEASFSPDGRQVVTASYDRFASLWEVNTGALISRFEPRAPVCSVQYSPDGSYLATACWDYDSTVRIWEAGAGKEALFLLRHTGYPVRVAYGPDGHRVAVAGVDGVIRVWDLAGNTWEAPTTPTVFSADGHQQVLIHEQRLEIPSLAGGPARIAPFAMDGSAAGAVMNPDGRRLLAVSLVPEGSTTNLKARLWSTQNGQPLGPAFLLTEGHTLAVLNPDGARLVTAARTAAEVWDTTNGIRLHVLSHSDPLKGIVCSSTGNRIATWCGTNAFLWKAADGGRVSQMPHPSAVGHAEFSPDGRYLVTCCTAGQLNRRFAELWDGESGTALGIRLWHSDGVNYASFSPDGGRIVTASEDRSARIWDRARGEQLTPPLVHRDQVSKARFSPDGRWVVTVCQDRSVRVWDAATGSPLTPGLPSTFDVAHVQFIEDGKRIFCSSREADSLSKDFLSQDWRIWDMSPDRRRPDQLELMAQVLSGRQGAELGTGLPMEQKALREAWRALRESHAPDFIVSPEEIRAWHRREARAGEQAERWFAARFHLSRLAQLLPNDQDIARRLARAESRLASGRNATP